MKKKIMFTIIIIIILLVMPINIIRLKDGGSKVYKGLIYDITKVHRLNEKSMTGYEDGIIISIFGIQIYNKTNINENNIKIDTLERPITIILKSGSLTNEKATFIITNNTDISYTYGPEYFLEKYENGKFTEIKLENPLTWNSIITTLEPGEKCEINIDFTIGYGKLSNGKYRLVKKANSEDNTLYINAEFEINDKKEVLELFHTIDIDTASNIDIKREVVNLKLKNKLEEKEWTYYSNGDLKEVVDFISKKYNIINNKWQYNIHFYDADKKNGVLLFRYVINKDILTNKAITCSIENNIITVISYTNVNKSVDENSIINKKNIFESITTQEKKSLNKNEEYIKEDVVYEYIYNLNKLLYEYNLFYYETYGDAKVINNSTVSSYFVDDVISDKNVKM